eukprot:scaffold10287_cov21-Tisochrysis_lutea.AAC.2
MLAGTMFGQALQTPLSVAAAAAACSLLQFYSCIAAWKGGGRGPHAGPHLWDSGMLLQRARDSALGKVSMPDYNATVDCRQALKNLFSLRTWNASATLPTNLTISSYPYKNPAKPGQP